MSCSPINPVIKSIPYYKTIIYIPGAAVVKIPGITRVKIKVKVKINLSVYPIIANCPLTGNILYIICCLFLFELLYFICGDIANNLYNSPVIKTNRFSNKSIFKLVSVYFNNKTHFRCKFNVFNYELINSEKELMKFGLENLFDDSIIALVSQSVLDSNSKIASDKLSTV